MGGSDDEGMDSSPRSQKLRKQRKCRSQREDDDEMCEGCARRTVDRETTCLPITKSLSCLD